jgi:soluble lytic murein transglycosylase-like protein
MGLVVWPRISALVAGLVLAAAGNTSAQILQLKPAIPAAVTPIDVQAGAAAPDAATSEHKPKSGGKSDFVRVLGTDDFARYQALFKLAAAGDLAGIEAQRGALQNKVLIPHILARAILSPQSTVEFEALKSWLDTHANYPEAKRIYALAKKKSTEGQVRDPERRIIRGSSDDAPDLTSEFEDAATQAVSLKLRTLIKNGQNGEAQSYLFGEARAALSESDFNKLTADLAAGFYYSGRFDLALQLAKQAAQAGDHAPLADWIAGLAQWRTQNYAQAAVHFEAMALRPEMTSWLKTSAAFWAGRAFIAAREPQKARPMFELAATKPRTFYGLIALTLLGEPAPFNWEKLKLNARGFQKLAKIPEVSRAVALAQLGQRDLAEDVLLRAHGRLPPALDESFIALANDMGFASVQFFAASAAKRADLKAEAYPIMRLEPKGGFKVDAALVHAIVRQESRFEADVESSSGARGLMQVLPSTAKLGEDANNKLFDPTYNLTVGQDYVRKMMGYAEPFGNLFQTVVAYNGGPGNLLKWRSEVEHGGDPLLFIESIPSRETRGYIERVMANMWIYQLRMGKPTVTLNQVAEGKWPVAGPDKKRMAGR